MKIFHLNPFNILFIIVAIGLGLIVPSLIIESIWNSSVINASFERDLAIEVWQAALLWGAILSALTLFGVFKFKIDLKTIDSIDLNQINDPVLKSEIEKLKSEYQDQVNKESKQDSSKENEDHSENQF